MVKGETLRNIAFQTYGNAKDYRYIFDANRSKFGISPHIIRIGQVLDLPCRGGLTTVDADTIVDATSAITETAPFETAEPEIVVEPVIVEIAQVEPTPAEDVAQPIKTDVAIEKKQKSLRRPSLQYRKC